MTVTSKHALKITAILATAALTVTGCGKYYTYKYKLTVSVRDHGELKSASTVVAVTEPVGPTGNSGRPIVCGEAAVLSLANGKTLFALLNGVSRDAVPGQFHWRSVPTFVLLNRLGLETQFGWKDDSGIERLAETRTRVDKLHSYEMPDFVTFRDTADPTTIEQVDPQNSEMALGDGVRLENVSLEASGERVTKGAVEDALPWFRGDNRYLDGSPQRESVRGYETDQFKRCSWIYLSDWL